MSKLTAAKRVAIGDYNYPLPEERIAKHPLADRSACKLLVPGKSGCADYLFSDLPRLLPSDALLVRNTSKVIKARIFAEKPSGAVIELFCLSPVAPSSYDRALAATDQTTWKCLIGNAKRWKDASQVLTKSLLLPDGTRVTLQMEHAGEGGLIRFSWDNPSITFGSILELIGELPIPPYLKRATEQSDLTDYQTVYASLEGSVAAPTAGLHFTDELLQEITAKGVEICDVCLHVGAGTFLPVKSEEIGAHEMHRELCSVTCNTLQTLLRYMGRIVAVGTTSVRATESLYHLARALYEGQISADELRHVPEIGQWQPYESEDPAPEASIVLTHLLETMQHLGIDEVHFMSGLLIVPGYEWRIINALITNFHQPKSTLLLMIAALIGPRWREVYRHALDNEYRFLSYGDASLLVGDSFHSTEKTPLSE